MLSVHGIRLNRIIMCHMCNRCLFMIDFSLLGYFGSLNYDLPIYRGAKLDPRNLSSTPQNQGGGHQRTGCQIKILFYVQNISTPTSLSLQSL